MPEQERFQFLEPTIETDQLYAIRDLETDEIVFTSPDRSAAEEEAARRNGK